MKKIVLLVTLVFLFFPAQVGAEADRECTSTEIAGREPISRGNIDPDFCSPIATCYKTIDTPIPTYDCYQILVAPTEAPPTTSTPVPTATVRPLEGVNLSEIQKGVGDFDFADKTLGEVVGVIIPYILGIAGIVLFLYLVWGGFDYMTSRGDPEATQKAQGKITQAIVGFVIIFIAYWLVQILGVIFKLERFGQIFGGS